MNQRRDRFLTFLLVFHEGHEDNIPNLVDMMKAENRRETPHGRLSTSKDSGPAPLGGRGGFADAITQENLWIPWAREFNTSSSLTGTTPNPYVYIRRRIAHEKRIVGGGI
jgi:hypothetical protein